MDKITILGAGAFGFALAKIISDNNHDKNIFLFDVQEVFINHIHTTRKHPIFHKDKELSHHVTATTNLKDAVNDSDIIILAIPSKFLRSAIIDFKKYLKDGVILMNVAKGLEFKTNMRISQVIEESLKDFNYNFCCLSGGMIAKEVILDKFLQARLAHRGLPKITSLAIIPPERQQKL